MHNTNYTSIFDKLKVRYKNKIYKVTILFSRKLEILEILCTGDNMNSCKRYIFLLSIKKSTRLLRTFLGHLDTEIILYNCNPGYKEYFSIINVILHIFYSLLAKFH